MTGIPERELTILLLSSRYDLSSFDSGDAKLNDFLKNDALREQKEFHSLKPPGFNHKAKKSYKAISIYYDDERHNS